MRRYETIFITDPDLADEERGSLTERLNDLISNQGGALLKIDEWGQKRLAYEIKKKQRGYYILLDYCGTGPLVTEMERLFRIDDKILKYMTVLLDNNTDIETAKNDIAREDAEKERALKEKAEAKQNISDTPAEESEASSTQSNAQTETSSSEESSKTDQNSPDASDEAPESEKSVTNKESGEKE